MKRATRMKPISECLRVFCGRGKMCKMFLTPFRAPFAIFQPTKTPSRVFGGGQEHDGDSSKHVPVSCTRVKPRRAPNAARRCRPD